MTTTSHLDAITLSRLRSGANDLQSLATAYGVDMPPEHRHAAQVAAAARRLSHEAPPAPLTLPSRPDRTADLVAKAATARMLARESTAVATELADLAERELFRTAYASIPAIFAALVAAFDKALAAFGELVETAPLEVTADTPPDRAAAHVELLRTVDQLTSAASGRVRLAAINGEETRGTLITWLVLAPKPTANITQVRAALNSDLPTDLAGWMRLAHLGASLAHDGEAQQRSARFLQATYHAGLSTPDGGRAERTYAEAVALVPAGERR